MVEVDDGAGTLKLLSLRANELFCGGVITPRSVTAIALLLFTFDDDDDAPSWLPLVWVFISMSLLERVAQFWISPVPNMPYTMAPIK